MPEDAVEKFLSDQKALEQQRQELTKETLRQKEAAIRSFDEKLARLGYNGAGKRSHHRPSPEAKKSS